jgi:hypothetical protein
VKTFPAVNPTVYACAIAPTDELSVREWLAREPTTALAKVVLSNAVPAEPPTCWPVLTTATGGWARPGCALLNLVTGVMALGQEVIAR